MRAFLRHPLRVSGRLLWFTGKTVKDGKAGQDGCYWDDMTLVPHMINLLSKRRVRASVSFTPIPDEPACRKKLARQLHSEVVRLKNGIAPEVLA